MKEKNYLKYILKLLEDNLQWGSSKDWTDKNFRILNQQIVDKTKINISPNTLRRLFGRIKTTNNNYQPQRETLNALASYLDFKHWEAFISDVNTNSSKYTEQIIEIEELKKKKINLKLIYFLLTFFILLLVGLYFYTTEKKKKENRKELQQFLNTIRGNNLVGTLPNTIKIYYDYKNLSIDSFFIDFKENKAPIYLSKELNVITYMYSIPNKYEILILNKERIPVKKITALVLTNDWNYLITLDGSKKIVGNSVPINKESKTNFLHISSDYLKENYHLDSKMDKYYIQLYKIDTFKVDGNNFIYQTNIRNSSIDGGIHCFNSSIYIKGKKKSIRISFVESGCEYYVDLMFSEKKFTGQHYNNQKFAIDLSFFRNIKILNKNKNVSISLDNELIFKNEYQQDIGEIIEISYLFRGSGSVDNIYLSNLNNTKIYKEDF